MIEEFGGGNFRQATPSCWRNFGCVRESEFSNTTCAGAGLPEGQADQLERIILISCGGVRREISNYIESDVTPELRFRIEAHLRFCPECKAVYDGMRNVLSLIRARDVIELPAGFSLRLYRRLTEICRPSPRF